MPIASLLDRANSIAPLVLCAAALGWAGNTIVGLLAVGEISPMLLIFLRWLVVLLMMLAMRGRAMRAVWPEMRHHLRWALLMGSGGLCVFNALFYIAAHYTSAINMGIMQGALPAMILIGSALLFGTRIRAVQIAGLLTTFCGAAVIVTRGAPEALPALRLSIGDVLILVACAVYAGFALGLQRRPDIKIDPLTLFGYITVGAFLTSIPMVAVEYAFFEPIWPGVKGWLIVLFVAVVPSFLSQIFFMRGVQLIGPEAAGLYANTVPVFAMLLAILLLGERFHLYHIPAILLVFAGIYLFEMHGQLRRKLRGKLRGKAREKPQESPQPKS